MHCRYRIMNIICPIEKCTGCFACLNICPKGAIIMTEDKYGFLYPKIDINICIKCGLCEKVCPVLTPVRLNEPLSTYAAVSSEEVLTSSSGGAAAVMTKYILSKGGIVYGCVQYNYKNICHARIDNINDIKLLKGSKYVQSFIGTIFGDVKSDLCKGVDVLFIGTPCQIAGLRNYLGKDYDNLYTSDLVCHGVPSLKMLIDDISLIKKSSFSDTVCFRENIDGKVVYGIFLKGDNGVLKSKVRFPSDPYLTAFMSGLSFRECCHLCKYAGSTRVGDITLADFWGLGKESKINTYNGVSLLLLNSDKGRNLFNEFSHMLSYEKRNLGEAIAGNGQLQKPFIRPECKDEFLNIYLRCGLKKAVDLVAKDYIIYWKKRYLKERIISLLFYFPIVVNVIRKVRRLI